MILVRHRLLGFLTFLAIIVALIATADQAVRAQSSGSNTWTTVAPLPEGRMWLATASANGKLYVFGGLGPTNFLATFESYDPRTNRWTSMGDMPETLGSLPSATTGPDGLTYLYGQPQGASRAVMLVYHPRTDTWTNAPAPFGELAMLVTGLDGRIYAVGGGANATLSAYDPSTHTWTSLAPDPSPPLYGPAAAVGPDGRIYVIGPDQTLAKVEAYDPQSNTWTPVAPVPTPRFGLQAVTGPDGRIYVLGGKGRCFTAPCDEVEAYDVRTNTWTSVAPMPCGRWQFAAAVALDGRIYVFCCGEESIPRPSFEVYDPRKNRWTEVAGLPHVRASGFVAAAAGDGHIDLIGGCLVTQTGFDSYCGDPSPVDAYDPRTNTWTSLGVTLNARQALAATTGSDGEVYAVGRAGYGNGRMLEVIRQGAAAKYRESR